MLQLNVTRVCFTTHVDIQADAFILYRTDKLLEAKYQMAVTRVLRQARRRANLEHFSSIQV